MSHSVEKDVPMFVYICRDCGAQTLSTLDADAHEERYPHHMMLPHSRVTPPERTETNE